MATVTLSDMKFRYEATTAETLWPADVTVIGKDVETDLGLETSVLISLGTDARASKADRLPEAGISRGGFWGSVLLGFNVGSKYWLLGRSNLTPETITLTKQYTDEALAWMITDGVASEINTTVTRVNNRQLSTYIEIVRPQTANIFFSYYINWENQLRGGYVV